MSRLSAAAPSAILIALLLALWQAVHLLAGPDALASPLRTLAFLGEEMRTPEFWGHVAATGSAFLLALLIAILGGLVLGLGAGASRTATETAEPLLLVANSVPKIVLYPIVLLIFGIGAPAKVAFGAMHGIIPVAVLTMNACRGLPPVLIKSAAAMRLSRLDTIRSILLPAILPEVVAGVRLGFSLTLIGTVLGEMFGSQNGLGYLLMTAIGLQNLELIMSVTLVLVVFAAGVSSLLLGWERRLRARRA